ncbi:anti-sigma factor [Ornithinimicrobium cerasi]|uniref:anti-sigma factor n=1 Tax=Ornithinimicrobium cerasi TaxID=2248773 RepID=UPI000EFE20FC|nr:anti-sigma factor [Ornithinimicrobium cerasi]
MNDQLRTTVRPGDPEDDSRATTLLRRAGVVEQSPPPHVWTAIVAGLRATGAAAGPDPAGMPQLTDDLARHRRRRAGRTGRGLALPILAAAAVGALVTWTGFELLGGADDGRAGQVLASGQLAPLLEEQPAGSAQVVQVDGHQRLRVELDAAPQPGEGYLEVWLLKPDASGMITLGVLDGDTGEYLLPAGLELAEFPVVDISREHMDGDPAHGGDSLVRGEVG